MKTRYLNFLTALFFFAAPAFAQNPVISPGTLPFSCFVENVTAMTQCWPAQTAPLRIYVMAANFSNEAASAQSIWLAYGSSTNCATNTTALTHKLNFGSALGTMTMSFAPSAIIVPSGNAVCVAMTNATAFGATLTGFISP